jgi:Arc/MetJ family transcription regulator
MLKGATAMLARLAGQARHTLDVDLSGRDGSLAEADQAPWPIATHLYVYNGVAMTRTNIEIDDRLVERAMRHYRLASKREAVDLALRRLVGEPLTRKEALAMEGSGWSGDLAEIRAPDEAPVSAPRR